MQIISDPNKTAITKFIEDNPAIRVLALGEVHHEWTNRNPFHEFVAGILPALKEIGFTHLAIEFDRLRKIIFDLFNSRHDEEFARFGLDMNTSYAALWLIAREYEMPIVPIDAPNTKYFQGNRNQCMFMHINELLDSRNRIVWLGGLNHSWIRSNDCLRRRFYSAAELLEGNASGCLYTIAQITPDFNRSPSAIIRFDGIETLSRYPSATLLTRQQLIDLDLATKTALSVTCGPDGQTSSEYLNDPANTACIETFEIQYTYWDSIYWTPSNAEGI